MTVTDSFYGTLAHWKAGTEPVTREDVERAIWTLTAWQGDQALVDELLAVVDAHVTAVFRGQADGGEASGDRLAETGQRWAGGACGKCAALELPRVTPTAGQVVISTHPRGAVSESQASAPLKGSTPSPVTSQKQYSANSTSPGLSAPDEAVSAWRDDEANLAVAAAVGQLHRCVGCAQLLPLDAFHRDKTAKRGVKSRCKECTKTRQRQLRHRDEAG